MPEPEIKSIFQAAVQQMVLESETPLRQLTRKILNEEHKYLYSEQGVNQRKKNIKIFIESARKSGQFKD